MAHAPFNRGLNSFLTGTSRGREPYVDWRMAKDFATVLSDLRAYDPEGLVPDAGDENGLPSLFKTEYTLLHVPAGVLLRSPDGEPVGGYLSCDVSIESGHRGLGLGRELVIERALRDGALPTWWLDEAAYSPEGLSCHESAWHHARANPKEMTIRIRRWAPSKPMAT